MSKSLRKDHFRNVIKQIAKKELLWKAKEGIANGENYDVVSQLCCG